MANIKINELQPLEFEFEELSDLELEAIVGGKKAKDVIGAAVGVGILVGTGNPIGFRF